eukprot:NODE_12840_length_1200_cov_5.976701.p8 GENE.NODE_12840_length_1200_cov_5.976701~~NODE_12840_length_1200_cov_5.976701.p8  ORF type:complete len:61 (+),score=14.78 NODE_12840_length_1200_cov_5.976701:580-762(+)
MVGAATAVALAASSWLPSPAAALPPLPPTSPSLPWEPPPPPRHFKASLMPASTPPHGCWC